MKRAAMKLVLCFFILLGACSGKGGPTADAGEDGDGLGGGDDGSGAGDADDRMGADPTDGADGPDGADEVQIPPETVLIRVPAPTRLCKSIAWGGDSVEHVWREKVRITLRAQDHLLSLRQDDFEYDWIELLEVATSGETLVPAEAGRFFREWSGTPGEGELRLRFRQRYAGPAPGDYVVELEFLFAVEGGVVNNPLLVLDEANLTRAPRFAGTFTHEYTSSELMSCSTALLEERRREFHMQNGDVLRLRSRGWVELFGFPIQHDTFIDGLEEAYFSSGSFAATVTDYFDLASTINHHGGAYLYWIHLDQPFGKATDLYIDEFSVGRSLVYLDPEGNVVDQQPWTEVP